MPPSRPHFRFEMSKETSITDKRTLAHLASQQAYNALTYSSRALSRLEESILWLNRLHNAENNLIKLDVFANPEEALAEQKLRAQTLEALTSVRAAVAAVKARRAEIAEQMEEEFDPFFRLHPMDPRKPKETPKEKPKDTPRERLRPESGTSRWLPKEPQPDQAPIAQVVPNQPPPPPMVKPVVPPPAAPVAAVPAAAPIKIDPRLLARARKEINARKE
jgi:hypothetical protein